MENLQQKADFLRNEYTALLSQLDSNAPRKWGKMDVQQMIEHMSDYVRIANGRTPMEIVTPDDKLPLMQGFLATEKPFRENTPNALMSDTPPPAKYATREEAIAELQEEIDHFFATFEEQNKKTIANPFFGHLNFDQQVQLLYKHATHHLRQFGVEKY
jgi:hypothetical protein